MDYSQFLLMKEELSLIAVIVILFIADLFMSPDNHKRDGKPMLNTIRLRCSSYIRSSPSFPVGTSASSAACTSTRLPRAL